VSTSALTETEGARQLRASGRVDRSLPQRRRGKTEQWHGRHSVLPNIQPRDIAEIMGREEEHVGRIIRRYVGRAAATQDLIRRLNERRT
jgi:hypothetical protein